VRLRPVRPTRPTYGGQAVIEGVMMRGPTGYAVAVRRPTGEIVTRFRAVPLPSRRSPALGWPLVRGVASLVDSLALGIEALLYSATEAAPPEERLGKTEGGLAVALGVLLAVGLFVLLPTVVAGPLVRLGAPPVAVNLAEGVLRLAILVAYVWAIGCSADIRRVYQYHGAEHKVINAYEAVGDWSPATAARFGTSNPRCGTSFLLLVAVVSVLLFSLFGWPNVWVRLATRLGLLPVVAGLAYEAMKIGASPSGRWRWVAVPGLWLQSLTTRPPDDGQLEVASRALAALDPPEVSSSSSRRR